MGDDIEKDLYAFYEYIHILDLAARVDMEIGYVQVVCFYQGEDLVDLVYGDAKLAFVVTGRDLQITPCHDIGTQTDAYRIAVSVMLAELLQVGQAVDIDDHAQATGFDDLFEGDAIGGIEDPFRGKAGLQGQFYFVDAAAVDICPKA